MRLDVLVCKTFGLPRVQARDAILEGRVRVANRTVTSPGKRLAPDTPIALDAQRLFVSRSGRKLDAFIRSRSLDLSGLTAADIGAATGGFCQVLLAHNVRKVYAVDVGKNQLHPSLISHPRVVNLAGTDIRALPSLPEPVDLITVDVSFIPVRNILPHVLPLLSPKGRLIVLIKPHFETGPRASRKPVSPAHQQSILEDYHQLFISAGLSILAREPSTLKGRKGNQEHFFLLQSADVNE